jgi:hypothetical protein
MLMRGSAVDGIRLTQPVPLMTWVSPGVSLAQGLTRAYVAQGGVTLGPEQGELGAKFCHLGREHYQALALTDVLLSARNRRFLFRTSRCCR